MDALSDVLRAVRLTGAVFLDAQFSAPWSLVSDQRRGVGVNPVLEDRHPIHYHLITQGTCFTHIEPAAFRRGETAAHTAELAAAA